VRAVQPNPLRVISLCSLILGVAFLAKSISTKTPKYVLHELLAFKVNKTRFFRKHISQKIESILGFAFCFLGFALQIYLEVEALAKIEHETGGEAATGGFTNTWLVLLGTVAAIIVIAVVLSRVTRWISAKIFVELTRFMVITHAYPLASDESLLLELGRILRIPRDEDDTTESYTHKVLVKMKVPGTDGDDSADRALSFR